MNIHVYILTIFYHLQIDFFLIYSFIKILFTNYLMLKTSAAKEFNRYFAAKLAPKAHVNHREQVARRH